MVSNSAWLAIQSIITKARLKRTDTFLREWILLNFNTAAFLSIFIFAYADLLLNDNTVHDDLILNIQIHHPRFQNGS